MKTIRLIAVILSGVITALPALAIDEPHREKARAILDKSITYLKSQQSPEGAWLTDPGPAVTALVAAGMIRDEKTDSNDPAVRKAIAYILSQQQETGGIHSGLLENYNTSICLMALGLLRDNTDYPDIAQRIDKAHTFLRGLQWSNQPDPAGASVDKDHPWYGGAGYGNKGRPDLSNTAMLIAGLRDSGLDCKDPAYQRAIVFVTRLQGTKANTEYADQIVPDGGFIYATSESAEKIGTLQTYADPPTATDSAGRSRLRTYGSMTYAGFMSYLYAELDREDPRVLDAYAWVQRNYTLDENPNSGMQGYYYYLHVFARAMAAWGEPTITTHDGRSHDWANELIDKLATLQREDGSFINDQKDRWMEGEPVLATAYAVLALQEALGR